MKFWTMLALVAALFLVVGCGDKATENGGEGDGGGEAKPAEAKDGFDSPKAVVDAMMKLQKEKENPTLMDAMVFMAPPMRQKMAFSMFFMGGMMSGFEQDEKKKAEMEKAFQDILSKHKVPEKVEGLEEGKMQEVMEDEKKLAEVAGKLFKDTDVLAFLEDMSEWQAKYTDEKGQDGMGPKITGVKDIKIEGDKATGVMEQEGGKTEKMQFVKIDGRWYANFD